MIITLFGKPGAGKSTVIAQFIQLNKKKKEKFYKRVSKSRLYHYLNEIVGQREEIISKGSIKKTVNGKPVLVKQKEIVKVDVFRKETKWHLRLVNKLLYTKNFYDVIYSTDPTFQDTIEIDYEHLGMWKPQWNSCLVLEEAGIGLSSRSYKSLSRESKRFAAMHRHAGCDILLASQTVDIDKAYRQRSQILFMVQKSFLFPELTSLRRIIYSVDVDDQTHDLVDAYSKMKGIPYFIELLISALNKKVRTAKFPFVRSRWVYRKKWYKYFDSFVDDFDYPMEDPYITYINSQKESENLENEEN